MGASQQLFERFGRAIATLTADQVRPPRPAWAPWMEKSLRLGKEDHGGRGRPKPLNVYYAPFGEPNPDARLILVGVAPGAAQFLAALRETQRAIAAGATWPEIAVRAARAAVPAGPTRAILVRWLDEVGLADALGIASCSHLFGSHQHLLHATSVVRYPTSFAGRDYTGHDPQITRSPLLRTHAAPLLPEEIVPAPAALIIPLGTIVRDHLREIAARGDLAPERCLWDFPYPSPGAGVGGRQARFSADREAMRAQLRAWFSAHPAR